MLRSAPHDRQPFSAACYSFHRVIGVRGLRNRVGSAGAAPIAAPVLEKGSHKGRHWAEY